MDKITNAIRSKEEAIAQIKGVLGDYEINNFCFENETLNNLSQKERVGAVKIEKTSLSGGGFAITNAIIKIDDIKEALLKKTGEDVEMTMYDENFQVIPGEDEDGKSEGREKCVFASVRIPHDNVSDRIIFKTAEAA